MTYICSIGESQFDVEIAPDGQIAIGHERASVQSASLSEKEMSLLLDGKSYRIAFCRSESSVDLLINGELIEVTVQNERDLLLKQYGGSSSTRGSKEKIFAPMPALVVKVEVREGDFVSAGQGLIILEAMKMENEIKSPETGKIKSIHVEKGNLRGHAIAPNFALSKRFRWYQSVEQT